MSLHRQLVDPLEVSLGQDSLTSQVKALVFLGLLAILEEEELRLLTCCTAALDQRQLGLLVLGQFPLLRLD